MEVALDVEICGSLGVALVVEICGSLGGVLVVEICGSVGVVVAGDGILVNSGYGTLFGGVGRYQAGAGNTLFVLNLPDNP